MKLSTSQACCLAQLCLAAALFSYIRRLYIMSQKGYGMVACSCVLGASGRADGYTQPFQILTET